MADESDNADRIERAMVVHAHPDDMEFMCGGTVARMAREGVEVTLVICTEGNRGGEGDRTEEELVAVRREEQAAAAKVLGINEVVYLGYDDGMLTPSLALRKDITRQIRKFRPNLVFCPNPVRHFGSIGGNHPDHLAVGEATFSAIYPTARNPMALPELMRDEGLDKWVVDWMYVLGRPEDDINQWEDITSTIDLKVGALAAHKSQLGPEVPQYMKWWAAELAKRAKARDGVEFEYVEGFLKSWVGEVRRPEDFKLFLKEEGVELSEPATAG